jgi:DNA-binding transcriptional MerR regulator
MARIYSVYGLAKELNMSVGSLRRWLDAGILPSHRQAYGKSRYFSEAQAREIRRGIQARRLGRSAYQAPPARPIH